jgi:uncharacterized membrane protein
MAFTLMLPIWIGRFYRTPISGEMVTGQDNGASIQDNEVTKALGGGKKAEDHRDKRPVAGEAGHAHPFFEKIPLSTLDLANLLAVGFLLVLLSEWVGEHTPGIPPVLWLTTFALLLGHTRPFRKPRGALQLGNLALHFFFVIIGIHSRVSEILSIGMEVFYFTLVVVGVHGLVVFGIGRLAQMDVGSLAVASQAAVGGPSSALAVAVSREWKGLILPGIIVGLLGYAVGNYLGFGVAYLLRAFGVGL